MLRRLLLLIATHITVAWSVRPGVVTLSDRIYVVCYSREPGKAVGRNEMSFGRDTPVVPSNTSPPREGEIWGVGTPVRSDAA